MKDNNVNTRNIEYLRTKSASLPRLPGVYIMKGKDGNVIYVGKSRSLKDRVSQYFQGSHDAKTSKMAGSVYDFEFIVCSSEMEALSLENRLIKHHTPKYNIRLKDAKSYPYIKVDVKSDYPSIKMTRTRLSDGALYFGPYSSTSTVYSVIASLERSLGIPSCKKRFPVDIGKGRPCVNYQIGRCVGLCSGKVSKEEYRDIIDTAINILKGGTAGAIKSLNEDMLRFSEAMEFERAAKCRDTIAALKKLGEKQIAVTSPDHECDVFGFSSAENSASLQDSLSVFYIRGGYITDREHILFDDDVIINPEADDSSDEESAFVSLITRIYADREYIPREILLSFELSDSDLALAKEYLTSKAGRNVILKTPKRGASKSLCELAVKDAGIHSETKVTKRLATEKMLVRLAGILQLEVVPQRIECYDVSNIGSEHITVGMIVSVDGKFSKKDYRTFNIKSLSTPDDYCAMKEAVLRRMAHTADKPDSPSPDLILLDGGLGHVGVISEALFAEGYSVPVFGMVKDEHHKTRTLVSSEGEIDISKQTDIFRFIYSLQEEVHRYTIGRMTKAKRKSVKHSSLEKIHGIGPAKAKALLAYFKTLSALKSADIDKISKVSGVSAKDAENIVNYFKSQN